MTNKAFATLAKKYGTEGHALILRECLNRAKMNLLTEAQEAEFNEVVDLMQAALVEATTTKDIKSMSMQELSDMQLG